MVHHGPTYGMAMYGAEWHRTARTSAALDRTQGCGTASNSTGGGAGHSAVGGHRRDWYGTARGHTQGTGTARRSTARGSTAGAGWAARELRRRSRTSDAGGTSGVPLVQPRSPGASGPGPCPAPGDGGPTAMLGSPCPCHPHDDECLLVLSGTPHVPICARGLALAPLGRAQLLLLPPHRC